VALPVKLPRTPFRSLNAGKSRKAFGNKKKADQIFALEYKNLLGPLTKGT
jgi:hypothetical protein